MKTVKLTERQRDALYSLIKPYSEGIAGMVNDKKDNTCFLTVKRKLFSAYESNELLELLKE